MSTLQYILFLSIPYYVQICRRVNPTAAGGGGGAIGDDPLAIRDSE